MIDRQLMEVLVGSMLGLFLATSIVWAFVGVILNLIAPSHKWNLPIKNAVISSGVVLSIFYAPVSLWWWQLHGTTAVSFEGTLIFAINAMMFYLLACSPEIISAVMDRAFPPRDVETLVSEVN